MNDFKQRGARFGGKRPSEMHQAMCAQCSKTCEVPFRPNGQRPVYCRECFRGTATPDSARTFQKPAFRAVAAPVQPQMPDPRIDEVQRSIAKIQLKLDQILVGMAVAKAQESVQADAVKAKKIAKKK